MMDTYKQRFVDFYRQHRRMPGYNEIMVFTGYKSKNAVHKFISKLVEWNVVSKDAAGKLRPSRLLSDIPLLGLVEAGFPSPAEEDLLDTISLEDWIINKREASYMLRVKGDSMYDAGMREGDMVVVERTSDIRNGDIVIAEIDGQWTMKYYHNTGGRISLVPANDAYPVLYPENTLTIPAKVIALIRKYS
jgi:SOS regulatory protein LexA